MTMRQIVVIVFGIYILAAGSPARVGDGDGFSAWASGRSGELDMRWETVTKTWAPASSRPDGTRTAANGARQPIRPRLNGIPASSLSSPGLGTGWTHSNLQFTSYDDGMLLLNSTRKRTGPSRGVSSLSSPAAATRGALAAGRTPFNRNAKYTRTIHTKGRNFGNRMSAPLHNRITRRSVTRTPSTLHGASRVRRQPSRGRW